MYTDEELRAPYTLPLPALDDTEDTPPFTQATDGLNIEPNQAPLDHPDIDEWGIYRGDEQEPNKPGDDIYYSDNEEESPFISTWRP